MLHLLTALIPALCICMALGAYVGLLAVMLSMTKPVIRLLRWLDKRGMLFWLLVALVVALTFTV